MGARDDLQSNLEFWAGRAPNDGANGEDPDRPRPSFRRRSWRNWRPSIPHLSVRSPRRARPIAAALLLAGLTTAWLVIANRPHGAPVAVGAPSTTSEPPTTAQPPATSTTVVLPTTRAPSTTVPVSRDCRGLTSAGSAVRCVIDAVTLDVRLLSPETVAAAYRRATGVVPAARSGPPACAHGVPDERAWSRPDAPLRAVGRYRCRLEGGRAEMWWTRGSRLVHALAADGDLGRLFSWWRAHPSE
jgi:hypothetical protein